MFSKYHGYQSQLYATINGRLIKRDLDAKLIVFVKWIANVIQLKCEYTRTKLEFESVFLWIAIHTIVCFDFESSDPNK